MKCRVFEELLKLCVSQSALRFKDISSFTVDASGTSPTWQQRAAVVPRRLFAQPHALPYVRLTSHLSAVNGGKNSGAETFKRNLVARFLC